MSCISWAAPSPTLTTSRRHWVVQRARRRLSRHTTTAQPDPDASDEETRAPRPCPPPPRHVSPGSDTGRRSHTHTPNSTTSPPSSSVTSGSSQILAQDQSPFFRKLPPEIRHLIYREYWRISSLNCHVFLHHGEYRMAPCIVDHDVPGDACQEGLTGDFQRTPAVQYHPVWFDRLTSAWCNHWPCEEAMRKRAETCQAGTLDESQVDNGSMRCVSLLTSCKRMYTEALPSLHATASLTITDKETLFALFIYPGPRGPQSPRHYWSAKTQTYLPATPDATHTTKDTDYTNGKLTAASAHPETPPGSSPATNLPTFLRRINTLNIALRRDAADFLYFNGAALWHALSPDHMPRLHRISLWIDGDCPVTRRLLPQFRDMWAAIPPSVADRLVVSFPCGEGGLWSWGEVALRAGPSSAPAWWPARQQQQQQQQSASGAEEESEEQVGGGGGGLTNGSPGNDVEEKYEVDMPGGEDADDVVRLPPFKPRFGVVLRGWHKFHPTCAGFISRVDEERGAKERRRFTMGNPFEDIRLYGRGWFDHSYY